MEVRRRRPGAQGVHRRHGRGQNLTTPGIAAAHTRSDHVDSLIASLTPKLEAAPEPVAVVALGAYGRRELTPRSEIELLLLSARTNLPMRWVTEVISYPLWEQHLPVEPLVRTLAECAADARRSWSAAARFLDARLVTGDRSVFDDFERQISQPWRRDRERLVHRVRADVQRRHASHASATMSPTPDLIAGRGGLNDLQALRWLTSHGASQRPPNQPPPHGAGSSTQKALAAATRTLHPEEDLRTIEALDFLLRTISAVEELVGHVPHRLPARVQERLARGGAADFLSQLFAHARWVAFSLDNALAPAHDDRQLGLSLVIRHAQLAADRLPPLARAPALGLRVANLVGLAPPDAALLRWASEPGPPIDWDEHTLDQFWLLLRAADWRAWEFLDVTGLLARYLPQLDSISRRVTSTDDAALDSHSFLALRRLHEWTESGDPLAQRAWRPLRRRDWLYLSVLLHELSPDSAQAAAERLGLPDDARDALVFVVGNYPLLADTATRRDLHDEDLLLELATRIGNRQRLSLLFLVAVAHDLASSSSAWTPWKADLMRQLFGRLDEALRHTGEVGPRRSRSLLHHRLRIAHALERRGLHALKSLVPRLPRRYVLTRTPAFVARHLALLGGAPPLHDGEVRMQAHRHRQPGVWDVQIVARDRPGLLATVAGVLALRGASVLAADAATCAEGLVLDVFTVSRTTGVALAREHWSEIAVDLQAALEGRIPLRDLLGARPLEPEEAEAIQVTVDNSASQFFSVVEVRAPDQVGLLYRITDGLHALGLDIHSARIATLPDGALDVFYVRDVAGPGGGVGAKLDDPGAERATQALAARLRGTPDPQSSADHMFT